MEGIAEMFGELDGYQEYWMELSAQGEYVREAHRRRVAEYRKDSPERVRASLNKYRRRHRDKIRAYDSAYRRRRRANDPNWRARRAEYDRAYYQRTHGVSLKVYGPVCIQHGTVNAYVNRGCRCRSCTDAAVARSREQRSRRAA
jgi:hypothetical protein